MNDDRAAPIIHGRSENFVDIQEKGKGPYGRAQEMKSLQDRIKVRGSTGFSLLPPYSISIYKIYIVKF